MKFKSELQLDGFNPRIEKAGDEDGDGAADIRFSGTVDIDDLKGLFATKIAYETIIERCFRDDGELVTPDLGSLHLATEGIGVDASIKSAFGEPLDFTDRSNINKIVVKPIAGKKAEISIRLQVHPEPEQVAQLFQLQHQGVTLSASWKKTKADEDAAKAKQKDLDLKRKDEKEESEGAAVH